MEKCNVNKDEHGEAIKSYEFLKAKAGVVKVAWNFTKFLLDRKGDVLQIYKSNIEPIEMVP